MTAVLPPPPAEAPEQEESALAVSSGATRRPTSDVPRQGWESLAIFVVVAGGFFALGNWMVAHLHLVGFDALDRYSRALMVWHNNPPKLAAVSLQDAPLPTLLLTPLTIARSAVSSLAVIPVSSAVFAGLAAVALNTMMRRCRVVIGLRYGVLVALFANPLVALYGSSGRSEMIWVALFLIGSGGIIAWYVTADVRFVLTAGLTFGIASLADYSSLAYWALAAGIIAAVLARNGAHREEIEGTVVGFATPVVYALLLWSVLNLLFVHNPIAWMRPHQGVSAPRLPFNEVLTATGSLIISAAPLAIIVLPLLIFRGLSRGDVVARWLALTLIVTIVKPGISAYFGLTPSPMVMSEGLMILAASVVGMVWLIRATGETGRGLALLLVVALVASVPLTYQQMKTYKYQTVEANFAKALFSGKSQEGTTTRSGQSVGLNDDIAMADYITAHVKGTGAILTDNAATYSVILLTGRPEIFFDRIDKGDKAWLEARANPPSTVHYMLISTRTDQDLIRHAYPDAAQGGDASLPVVYRNDHYALVSVATVTPSTTPTQSTSPTGAN